MTIVVTDDSFEADVKKSSLPVIVDFWAEWCGPCKQIAKLNIDENPTVPSQYGVRGIPTLMLFKDGEVAATKIGALPKNKLLEWVQSVI